MAFLKNIRIIFHFGIIMVVRAFLVSSNQTVDWRYNACKPRSCGNGPTISYPFQIIEDGSNIDFCGYPGFEVKCENRTPIYATSLSKYIVEDISFKKQSFRLVNTDVMHLSSFCRVPSRNFSFDRSSLDFGPNFVDLYLFYNCSNEIREKYTRNPITCLSSSNFTLYNSFAVLNTGKDDVNCTEMPCESYVHAPVELAGGRRNLTVEGLDYLQLLENGFTLRWSGLRCGVCKKSGGHCGYTHRKPVCFCTDGVHHKDCNDETRNKKVIIASAIIGSAVILAICMAFFIIRRRYKWRNISYYFSSKKSPQDLEAASRYFGVPVFSYRELEEATHNFDPNKELGDGGFGAVYYGKLRDGREVAVKRLYENNYKRVEQFMNEVNILTRLRHPNLVLLYGCTSHRSRELLLVYEYIPNGTVADHLHGERAKPGLLTWPIRMNIAVETASALAYLHKSDVIHRDVKSNNILIDENFCVKVADFGLSRLFPNDVSHVSTAPQGTPGYVDPEYHQCYQLTDKSDVYSFGVVLVELISSMPAVDISRHRHEINLSNLAINRIQKCAFDELIDPSLGFGSDDTVNRMTTSVAELAFRCLQFDKEMRPAMDEVLAVLKEIQGEVIKEGTDVVGGLKSVKPPPSPESEEARLLKNPKFPPSPISVTNNWHSGNSTTPYTSA